jgi:DNA-binding NtrC family response regulator
VRDSNPPQGWIQKGFPRAPFGDTLRDKMNRMEAWLIRRALGKNGQRRTPTARKRGITREGLYK